MTTLDELKLIYNQLTGGDLDEWVDCNEQSECEQCNAVRIIRREIKLRKLEEKIPIINNDNEIDTERLR